MKSTIIVRADWDDEARVWVASSADIEGLAVECETFEGLEKKVIDAICDLFEMNGFDSDLAEVPVHIMAEHLARVPNPCH